MQVQYSPLLTLDISTAKSYNIVAKCISAVKLV